MESNETTKTESAVAYRLEGGGLLIVPYGVGIMIRHNRPQASRVGSGDALEFMHWLDAQAREIREAIRQVNEAVEEIRTGPKERP